MLLTIVNGESSDKELMPLVFVCLIIKVLDFMCLIIKVLGLFLLQFCRIQIIKVPL